MNSNPAFVLLTIAQMLHALLASTAQYPSSTYMPVPADNVTVSGLASDAQAIFSNEKYDVSFIKMADPRGVVVPTSTVLAAEPERVFIDPKPMYDVFQATKF